MDANAAVNRVYNFSAGPAVLPLPVLEQAQRELLALPGCGVSVLEISHRSKPFEAILADAKARLKSLLQIPDNYRILFLQGGARLQFSMIPMNILRGTGKPADYILTGSWGKNAYKEGKREGEVRIAWDGKESNYDHVPSNSELKLSADAAMVHITSNETIEGVQFATEPDVGKAPLVCDASSDFLSHPVPINRYGIIYACAEERGAGRSDRGGDPGGFAVAQSGYVARLPEFRHPRSGELAVEHTSIVRSLRGRVGGEVAAGGHRWTGQDAGAEPAESGHVVRRH